MTIDPTTPTSGGVRVVELNSINFNSGDEVITPEHAQQIDRVVAAMETAPRATVHVVGNTDQQGDETRNLVVSQRRADAVVAYLVSEGIDPARLTTQPAGESNPLRTDATPEADAINRRVDSCSTGCSTSDAQPSMRSDERFRAPRSTRVGGIMTALITWTVALPVVMSEHVRVAAPSLMLIAPSASAENVNSPPLTVVTVPASSRSAELNDSPATTWYVRMSVS